MEAAGASIFPEIFPMFTGASCLREVSVLAGLVSEGADLGPETGEAGLAAVRAFETGARSPWPMAAVRWGLFSAPDGVLEAAIPSRCLCGLRSKLHPGQKSFVSAITRAHRGHFISVGA